MLFISGTYRDDFCFNTITHTISHLSGGEKPDTPESLVSSAGGEGVAVDRVPLPATNTCRSKVFSSGIGTPFSDSITDTTYDIPEIPI